MFAIAFDLIVAETAGQHPKGVAQSYAEFGQCLARFGFSRVQGSLHVTDSDNLEPSADSRNRLGCRFSCCRGVLPKAGKPTFRHAALAQPFQAISALKGLSWFPACVRDIRAFKVEHWSDFTQVVKERL